MSKRGWLLFAAMGVIWGVPYLFIKVAVGVLTPASLVLLRTGLAALHPAADRGRPRRARARCCATGSRCSLFTVAELAVPWLLLSDGRDRGCPAR